MKAKKKKKKYCGMIEVHDAPIRDLKIIGGKLYAIGDNFIAEINTKKMKGGKKVIK